MRKDKGVMNIRNTTDRYCEVAQCVYFAVTFTFLTPDLLCLSSLASTILVAHCEGESLQTTSPGLSRSMQAEARLKMI